MSAVQHSPGEVVKPEVGQRREYDGEISSTVGGKKSGYVLNEHPFSAPEKVICDPCELEEEAASLSCESCSPAGDGEVLAGESSAKETKWFIPVARPAPFVRPACNDGDIVIARDSRPMPLEDSPSVLVLLALKDNPVTCSLQAQVKATDSGEEGADSEMSGTIQLLSLALCPVKLPTSSASL